MKIITPEERKAHDHAVLMSGLKGAAIGTAVSLAASLFAVKKYPQKVNTMTYSIRTALFVTPPTLGAAIGGDHGSQNFDKDNYLIKTKEYQVEQEEEKDKWKGMSQKDIALTVIDENKYKIITGLWALSMWGSWEYVNRDKLLTNSQKFYEARMYAQFITIILLLGSIGLSMTDENKSKKMEVDDDEFMKTMVEKQKREAAHAKREKEQHAKYIAEQNAKKEAAAAAAAAAKP